MKFIFSAVGVDVKRKRKLHQKLIRKQIANLFQVNQKHILFDSHIKFLLFFITSSNFYLLSNQRILFINNNLS
jgi:hypothetical protein